jgi:hypothetical protein
MFIRNVEATLRVFDLIWLNNIDVHRALLEQNSRAVLLLPKLVAGMATANVRLLTILP